MIDLVHFMISNFVYKIIELTLSIPSSLVAFLKNFFIEFGVVGVDNGCDCVHVGDV